MKTQYYTGSSLDGFIADADNSLDWLLQFGEPPESSYPKFMSEVGAIAMGSTTYEWILEHDIYVDGQSKPWPYEQPTWVFTTRTLPGIEGADIRFVQGYLAIVHKEMSLAAQGKISGWSEVANWSGSFTMPVY
jgi:dihydrofolate reductase